MASSTDTPMQLKPFQVEGVRKILHFLEKNGSVYCADEQGIGKTIQTIEVINILVPSKTIIVCPKVMLYTWGREIDVWIKLEKARVAIVYSSKQATEHTIENNDIILVTYGILRRNWYVFTKHKYTLLVLDEAQKCKDRTTQTAEAVLEKIWPRCHFQIALSGTPFTQNVVDGYSIFSKMLPSHFQSFREFAARYSYSRSTPWATVYEGIRNAPELKQIIRENFYFRRTKKEVFPELPDKIFQKILLGPEYRTKTPKTEKAKIEQELYAIQQSLAEKGMTSVMTATVAGERRLQGEMKVPAALEFISDQLDQDIPLVVFAYHKNVIDALLKGLQKYKPVSITGDTSAKARMLAVKHFQEGDTNLFIGQIGAASVGITLTRSSTIIVVESDWSPAVMSQAFARCHRIGQTETLVIYYLVVGGTVDEDIIETVMRKAEEFSQVVEN